MTGDASHHAVLQDVRSGETAGQSTAKSATATATTTTGTTAGTTTETPAPTEEAGAGEPASSGPPGRRPGAAEIGRRLRGASLGTARRTRARARRHPIFTVILATAALLRICAMIGYQPAMYFNDTFDYLHVAMKPYPHPLRPDGYSFLLLILRPFHSFALVVGIQHLMGLAMGVMIYALLRRRFGLPGWGAALAAAPVLLDAYQIQLEQLVLSDTLFTFLVISAVTLLLWNDTLTWRLSAALGLIIALSWLTRSVGLPVLLGVLAFMLIKRTGWRTIAVMLATCMLPIVAYMGWYKVDHGKFAMTESNGIFLYARVYKFADCHKIKNLPVVEMPLCTEQVNRLPNSQDGIWDAASPLNRYVGYKFDREQNAVANDFSKRAIMAQPDDYARVVAGDFFRVFRWDRTVFPDQSTYEQYEFGKTSRPLPEWRLDDEYTAAGEAVAYENGRARTKVVEPFAGIMRAYQDVFYLRGTMVGVLLLIGLAGILAMWRPREWFGAGRPGGAALLPWTLATGLLLAPAATAEFDYRYVLPSIPLAAIAAGITFSPAVRAKFAALNRWRRESDGDGDGDGGKGGGGGDGPGAGDGSGGPAPAVEVKVLAPASSE
ncbi:hypothetical protein [Spirillospora sp. NPDC047279]|uniref:hypothetical protein n=1 Tax=Spirillospora sp. NPDC047279 TaxID=3155478 RepID=UPI0033E5213B